MYVSVLYFFNNEQLAKKIPILLIWWSVLFIFGELQLLVLTRFAVIPETYHSFNRKQEWIFVHVLLNVL